MFRSIQEALFQTLQVNKPQLVSLLQIGIKQDFVLHKTHFIQLVATGV